MRAKLLQFFVQSKTGRLSRDFEEHATRFAKIDRVKINAIDYGRNVEIEIDQLFAPLKLLSFVTRAKGDVMHRPGSDTSGAGIRQTKQIDDSAWRSVVMRCEPKPVSRFLDQTVTKRVGEQTRRLFVPFQSSRHAVKPRSACSGGTELSGHCSTDTSE